MKIPKKTKKTTTKSDEAPKKSKSKVKDENLTPAQAFVKSIQANQHYKGVVQIQMASEAKTTYLLRRPTGILTMDIALGGGLHAGGTAEVFGAESVGKTHLSLRVAGEVQRIYGPKTAILIFTIEARIDKGYMRKSGVCIAYSNDEIREFEIIRMSRGLPAFTSEETDDLKMQIGDIVVLSASTSDMGLDAIVEGIKQDVFQLIILESLGAFLSKEVDGGWVGDQHYAGASRIVTQFQNQVYPLLVMDQEVGEGESMIYRPRETTIIGVNQARASMDGGPKGPKIHAASGAYAWKHGQLVSIQLSKGKSIPENERPHIGRTVNWKLHKGKAGTHDGKYGTYDYYHMERDDPTFWKKASENFYGVDVIGNAIEAGIENGVITQAAAWLEWNGLRANGREKFTPMIQEAFEDPAVYQKFYDSVLAAANILVRYQ